MVEKQLPQPERVGTGRRRRLRRIAGGAGRLSRLTLDWHSWPASRQWGRQWRSEEPHRGRRAEAKHCERRPDDQRRRIPIVVLPPWHYRATLSAANVLRLVPLTR
jgi:hypothetical protein